jgi:Holliday junction resolvasome RuvABC DNA-binding subunit
MPSDLFTLGYVENNHISPAPVVHNTTNVTNVNKVTKNNTITKLQLDCIDTLVALGYKKMVARKMVLDYFKVRTAKNVQEFLSDILKK